MLGDGESQLWEVTRKSTVNKAKVVMQICPGLLIGSVGRLGTERETPLGMNILLTNVNVLFTQGDFSLDFTASPMSPAS